MYIELEIFFENNEDKLKTFHRFSDYLTSNDYYIGDKPIEITDVSEKEKSIFIIGFTENKIYKKDVDSLKKSLEKFNYKHANFSYEGVENYSIGGIK